jgi:hypothetical protein
LKNNYEDQFSINLMFEGEIEKKYRLKKLKGQLKKWKKIDHQIPIKLEI